MKKWCRGKLKAMRVTSGLWPLVQKRHRSEMPHPHPTNTEFAGCMKRNFSIGMFKHLVLNFSYGCRLGTETCIIVPSPESTNGMWAIEPCGHPRICGRQWTSSVVLWLTLLEEAQNAKQRTKIKIEIMILVLE